MSEILLVKRPQVAGAPRKTPVAVAASTIALIGIMVFLWLSSARAALQDQESTLPPLTATTATEPQAASPATPPPVPAAPTAFFVPKTGPVTLVASSPAVDDLGRGGIGGKVNRHFLQRFGGAILTSVLSGGISAAAASLSGGSTVIVGSASQATGLASQASQSTDIPPTITTRQGASVRIFVARDLDFSRVGPTP